ncbi:MAG: hypothetical protein IJR85_06935 [Synergistaceae bacterium]|nr:hypothetical protein [Synergistaceae bacterium]
MKKVNVLSVLLFLGLMSSYAYGAVSISEESGNFPNDAFREYVSENFDTDRNGELSDEELAAVTVIDVHSMDIASLGGIEYFTELRELECSYNSLTELDMSRNPKLQKLYCWDNQLAYVDTRRNPELLELSVRNNRITAIDVKNNPKLRLLSCWNNQLTEIDITHNPELISFDCHINQIANIDLSSQRKLRLLNCAVNRLTELHAENNSLLRSLSCYGNTITKLDVKQFPNLIMLDVNENRLSDIDVSSNLLLSELYCNSNDLTALDVTHNPELSILSCSFNNIGELDLRNNPALTKLWCVSCGLSELNLSNNTALISVNCWENSIKTLDISNHHQLTEFYCYSNDLSVLNVSNASALQVLGCENNSLSELDITTNPALIRLWCNNNNITSLDMHGNPDIETLSCMNNELQELNVSDNSALTYLYCRHNQLRELRLKNHPALSILWCENNDLRILDTSGAPSLLQISSSNNPLGLIDVSSNTALISLYCGNSQLAHLDVSKNEKLTALYCENNHLPNIDLSRNTALQYLYIQDNHLTSIDLSANTELQVLDCSNNGNASLYLTTSGFIFYPYQTDLTRYAGQDLSRIQGLKAYDSQDVEIDCDLSLQEGIAYFASEPKYIVYEYDNGYSGTASEDLVPRTMSVKVQLPSNHALLTQGTYQPGSWNTNFFITPELREAISLSFGGISSSDIHLFSEIITSEDWTPDPDETSALLAHGEKVLFTLPQTQAYADGVYVIYCTFGSDSLAGNKISIHDFDSISHDSEVVFMNEIGQVMYYVSNAKYAYVAIRFTRGQSSRYAMTLREELPLIRLEAFRPDDNVMMRIAENLSVDVSAIKFLNGGNIIYGFDPSSPHEKLAESSSLDIIGKFNSIGYIDEAGTYLCKAVFPDELFNQVKDKDIMKNFVLQTDYMIPNMQLSLSGDILQSFGTKEFIMTLSLEPSTGGYVCNLYLTQRKEAISQEEVSGGSGGGCNPGAGIFTLLCVVFAVCSGIRKQSIALVLLMIIALYVPAYAEIKASDYTLPIPYEIYDIAGICTTDFELTPELVNKIAELWIDPMRPDLKLKPEQVHSYSEAALPGSWEVQPDNLYTIASRGSYGVAKLPLVEAWPGEENYTVYVTQITLSYDVQPDEMLTMWTFPVDISTRKTDNSLSEFVGCAYLWLDENFNKILRVPQSRRFYAAIFIRPETVNTGIICVNRGAYVNEEDIVKRLESDFTQKVAAHLGIDVEDLRYILKRNIGQPIEPTQAMQDYVRNDNHEIIGNLPTVSVDEAGYYIIPVTLSDDVFNLVKSNDVSDYKFYALNDSELGDGQIRTSFINGLLGTWELFTLNGEKMTSFGVKEFLMVGFLEAGKPFSLYLAKILLALLAGGCHSGISPSAVHAVILGIIAVKLYRRK